jgi:Heavy metal associated domain 2
MIGTGTVMLEYTHFVPGRLRLKSAELRDERKAAETATEFAAMPAVTRVVANPITGSLTINFDKRELAISQLWESLLAKGYVSGRCPEPAGAGDWSADGGSAPQLAKTVMSAIFDAIVQHSAQALVRELL